MKLVYPKGATPLNSDDLKSLIPKHIITQNELNEWEALNISRCELWLNNKHELNEILTLDFIKKLHKQMFGDTWGWAGKLRNCDVNIGNVRPFQIQERLKTICDDTQYHLENNTYPKDEAVIRFHHNLVWIHAFPNGNGRHARLIADLLITSQGGNRFSWGNHDLYNETTEREKYIKALQLADKGDYSNLIKFSRS